MRRTARRRAALVACSVLALLVTASLAAYFLFTAATESGADCTFDNLDCASNRDLATGLGWLLLFGVLVVAVATVLLVGLRRARRRRMTPDQAG